MDRRPATLGTLLRRLIEFTDHDVEEAYRIAGLDYRPRFTPVVRFIAEHGPASIRSLSLHASITHSAASQTVSEMTRRGLVELKRCPEDGRERIVHLTAKCEAMLPELRRCWAATAAAAADLSEELGFDLERHLARAVAALEQCPFGDRIAAAREAVRSVEPHDQED